MYSFTLIVLAFAAIGALARPLKVSIPSSAAAKLAHSFDRSPQSAATSDLPVPIAQSASTSTKEDTCDVNDEKCNDQVPNLVPTIGAVVGTGVGIMLLISLRSMSGRRRKKRMNEHLATIAANSSKPIYASRPSSETSTSTSSRTTSSAPMELRFSKSMGELPITEVHEVDEKRPWTGGNRGIRLLVEGDNAMLASESSRTSQSTLSVSSLASKFELPSHEFSELDGVAVDSQWLDGRSCESVNTSEMNQRRMGHIQEHCMVVEEGAEIWQRHSVPVREAGVDNWKKLRRTSCAW
ncbi:MAG: hypothetical protein MMC23_000479 [Stictis urceolatum]|nr:hypothetical protein [Stictis urceolata]